METFQVLKIPLQGPERIIKQKKEHWENLKNNHLWFQYFGEANNMFY